MQAIRDQEITVQEALPKSSVVLEILSGNAYESMRQTLLRNNHKEGTTDLHQYFAYYDKAKKMFYYCDYRGIQYELDSHILKRYLFGQKEKVDNEAFKNLISQKEDPFPGFGNLFIAIPLALPIGLIMGFGLVGTGLGAWIIPVGYILLFGLLLLFASAPVLYSEHSNTFARIIFVLSSVMVATALAVLITASVMTIPGFALTTALIVTAITSALVSGISFTGIALYDRDKKENTAAAQMTDEELEQLLTRDNSLYLRLDFTGSSKFGGTQSYQFDSGQVVDKLPRGAVVEHNYSNNLVPNVVISPRSAEAIQDAIRIFEQPYQDYIYLSCPSNLSREDIEEVVTAIKENNMGKSTLGFITETFNKALKAKSEEKKLEKQEPTTQLNMP